MSILHQCSQHNYESIYFNGPIRQMDTWCFVYVQSSRSHNIRVKQTVLLPQVNFWFTHVYDTYHCLRMEKISRLNWESKAGWNPYHWLWGLNTTDGYGIFNMCTNLGACLYCTHEVGSGANKSAQELSRRKRKNPVSYPAPSGDRTQGLWNRIPTL